MTDLTPRRRALIDGFTATVAAVSGLPTEFGEIPDGIEFDDHGLLVKPYHIVDMLPGQPLPEHGSLERREECVLVSFQVRTIGATKTHAVEAADACRAKVLARDPNGDFTHAIAAGDQADVIDRRTATLGAPDPAGGGLWQVADVYDLEVLV